MKVKELIELLQKEDPELLVIGSGYDGGYRSINRIDKIQVIHKDYHWGGDYSDAEDDVGYIPEDAIFIHQGLLDL